MMMAVFKFFVFWWGKSQETIANKAICHYSTLLACFMCLASYNSVKDSEGEKIGRVKMKWHGILLPPCLEPFTPFSTCPSLHFPVFYPFCTVPQLTEVLEQANNLYTPHHTHSRKSFNAGPQL